MDELKGYLLSWFPMFLLIGVWLYAMRKHNVCKTSGGQISDKLAQEQLALEREKLAEARRTNGLLKRLLNEQSERIASLAARLGSSPLHGKGRA